MRKFEIAVDLDGVIWDLLNPWLSRYNNITGGKIDINDIKSYELDEYIEHRELLQYILKMNDFWESVEPYPGAVGAIDVLLNHPLVNLSIVTATSYEIAHMKIKRLLELIPSLPEENIILTSKKELIAAHVLIDDYENNLRHMAVTGKGVPILIDQPYNRNFDNNTYGVVRCNSLIDAVSLITCHIYNGDEIGGIK